MVRVCFAGLLVVVWPALLGRRSVFSKNGRGLGEGTAPTPKEKIVFAQESSAGDACNFFGGFAAMTAHSIFNLQQGVREFRAGPCKNLFKSRYFQLVGGCWLWFIQHLQN